MDAIAVGEVLERHHQERVEGRPGARGEEHAAQGGRHRQVAAGEPGDRDQAEAEGPHVEDGPEVGLEGKGHNAERPVQPEEGAEDAEVRLQGGERPPGERQRAQAEPGGRERPGPEEEQARPATAWALRERLQEHDRGEDRHEEHGRGLGPDHREEHEPRPERARGRRGARDQQQEDRQLQEHGGHLGHRHAAQHQQIDVEGQQREGDQHRGGRDQAAEPEPEEHQERAARQRVQQAARPEAHPEQGEDHEARGLEERRQQEVDEPLGVHEMAEERHLPGVGDPAPLVRDVADPGVVVGIGVEVDEAQAHAGHQDGERREDQTAKDGDCRHGATMPERVAPKKSPDGKMWLGGFLQQQ